MRRIFRQISFLLNRRRLEQELEDEMAAHREMMDLEGLKQWLPGRTTGFGPLTEAVTRQHYFADETA